MMEVDQTLLQQMVLKKMKVDWCMFETVVIAGQGRHLKVDSVLQKQTQYGECMDA